MKTAHGSLVPPESLTPPGEGATIFAREPSYSMDNSASSLARPTVRGPGPARPAAARTNQEGCSP